MHAFTAPFVPRVLHGFGARSENVHRCHITARNDRTRVSSAQQQSEAEYARELAWVERKYGRRLRSSSKGAEVEVTYGAEAMEVVDARSVEAATEATKEYERLSRRIVGDTAFVGAVISAAGWAFGSVASAESVLLGSAVSLFYVFLLSKGVGGGAGLPGKGEDRTQGSRLAVIVCLVFVVAKSGGQLQILPAILGFLSYKIAFILPLISGEAFLD